MENKKLSFEDLEYVAGGNTGVGTAGYNLSGHKCPKCGSMRVEFLAEQHDKGVFNCKDCGHTFYDDLDR